MKCFKLIPVLTLLHAGLAIGLAQDRDGRIDFSDSTRLSGVISLTPGSELKLEAGSQIRALALDRVREIRFAPEQEEMERAWRFKEAGQTAKEFFGAPYPVRHLAATITLDNGETIRGHLYTTVLYVTDGDNVRKVILLAKQRGKEGDTFQSLAYPQRISFGDSAAATAMVKLKLSGLGPKPEVVAITRGALARLEAAPDGGPDEFEMPSPLGKEFFVAAKSGPRIVVGWPKTINEKILKLVRGALTNSEDFFDDRRIVGAFADTTNSEIYSLIFAARKGKTTLDTARSQPWRLALYRWKLDDDGRVMLAGQDYFFRGIGARNEAPPAVELSEKLWQLHQNDGVWTTRDE